MALVDLTQSTRFKALFPAPDIWLERLSSFLETARFVADEVFEKPFIKYLGDGVLIYSKSEDDNPLKFLLFAEQLVNRVIMLNDARYTSEPLTIEFTCAIDHGSDIYLFQDGDPQGLVIDRVFRISNYLMPNMIGVSSSFYEHFHDTEYQSKFAYAGKAYLKGISDQWQDIFALKTINNFSIKLSPEQKRIEALADIWEMSKGNEPIWIISGPIRADMESEIEKALIPYGDFNALIEIVRIISKLYPQRPFKIATSIEYLKATGGSFNNDIISIGGPYYNLVSMKLINKHHLPIYFELDSENINEYKDPILTYYDSNKDNIIYETERIGSKMVSDAFVFIKLNNQITEGKFHYLIMGNQMQGTSAAARMLGISSPYLLNNYKNLKDILMSFEQGGQDNYGFGIINRVTVIDDFIEPVEINLTDSQNLKIFILPPDYEFNITQNGPPQIHQ